MRPAGCVWLWMPLWMWGCGANLGPADGGPTDGELVGDVDPCEAALARWVDRWEIVEESSGLEGSTPEINLMDVWGGAADDVYAVGFDGNILHFGGDGWTSMTAGSRANLEGVWGYVLRDDLGATVRTDVFAVGTDADSGEAVVLRYNGTSWMPMRVISDPDPAAPDPQPVRGSLHDVWGVAASAADAEPKVVAVGGEGLIVKYDAALGEFREMRTPVQVDYTCGDQICQRTVYNRFTPERLGGVYGSASDDFVAVGNNGTIVEFDGSTWERYDHEDNPAFAGFITHLNGVWGRDGSEVFAVGLDGTILRRNASRVWEELADLATAQGGHIGLPPVYLRSVWGFYQSKCGEIPEEGAEPRDDSWVVFTGWNNQLYLFHDKNICPFGNLQAARMEGAWGLAPRPEAERTLPDGTIECDPVEVLVTGVNGSITRLKQNRDR